MLSSRRIERGSFDNIEVLKHKLKQQVNSYQSTPILETPVRQINQSNKNRPDGIARQIRNPAAAKFFMSSYKRTRSHLTSQDSLGANCTHFQQYAKQSSTTFFGHTKSKSPQSYTHHMSIITGPEESLWLTPLKNYDNKNSSGKQYSPLKIRANGSAQRKNSINSQDLTTNDPQNYQISNGYHSTQPSSSRGRPESVSQNKFQILKRKVSVDEEKSSTFSSSMISNQQTISQFKQTDSQMLKQPFITDNTPQINNYQIETRPSSQSCQMIIQKRTQQPIQRPQTGEQKRIQNIRENKKLEENDSQRSINLSKNTSKIQTNRSQEPIKSKPQDDEQSQIHHNKKKSVEYSISLYEDNKLLLEAHEQMQKAIDKYLVVPPKNNVLYNQQTISSQPTIQSYHTMQTQQNNNLTQNASSQQQKGNVFHSQGTIPSASESTNNKKIIEELEKQMKREQKEFVRHILQPHCREEEYTNIFKKVEKIVQTKDLKLLVQMMIFLAEATIVGEDYDKTAFFLFQAKVTADMSKNISNLKPKIYTVFGDMCIKMSKFTQALVFYKKALQYAWFHNQSETEINLFDKLGVNYFYLQDEKLSDFYHTRFTSALNELPESHIKNISHENITEYHTKMEYNINYITPILMVRLQLPVEYSIDKMTTETRELQLKQQLAMKKRGSNADEQLEWLLKESQQEIQIFKINRERIFQMATASKIIESIITEDSDFIFQIDTPTFFPMPDKETQEEQAFQKNVLKKVDKMIHSSLVQFTQQDPKKKVQQWVAPVIKKLSYDTSKFGPILDPRPSKRVFEDTTKYKLSLEKQINVLMKQKFDYDKTIDKVSNLVGNNMKFQEPIHQRVRISHISPNRFDPLKYNTPFSMIQTINRSYNSFLKKLNKYSQKSENDKE